LVSIRYTIKIINTLVKQFGLIKTVRIVTFHIYRIIRLYNLDLTKNRIVEVNGYKLWTIPEDRGISAELLMFKTHEPITTRILSKELSEGMVCLDIGSNIGYYAFLESKKVGKTGKVIAVEPSPLNFNILKKNLSLQKLSNIQIYNFACGNTNGEVNFLLSNKSNWCKVISESDKTKLSQSAGQVIKVPIKKIESFLEEKPIEKLDYVRMDVEGYELDTYLGMQKIVKRFKPALLIEFHYFFNKDKAITLLQELKTDGYSSRYFIPRSLDMPIIGKMEYCQEINMNELLEKAKNGQMTDVFHVFLSNKT